MVENEADWTKKFKSTLRYEILWNIRKKKFLGMIAVAFLLATLSLAGGHLTQALGGPPVEANPEFVINQRLGLGGFGFFLFALVTAMNSISAEFEKGTIVPLLAKPISRTTVFLGKMSAAFLTLLVTYSFLTVYMTIGGFAIYGPQNNLHLVPLSLIGAVFSTLIWVAIVLFFGTIARSSLIAALGALGIWMGTNIIGSILSVLAGQGWILKYIPGTGNTGYVGGPPGSGTAIATGTDSIGANLINYILHPSWEATYYKIDLTGATTGQFQYTPLSSEPISSIVLTSIGVALTYFVVFTVLSWFIFKNAEITE